MIVTVSENQHEILRHILSLYLPGHSTFALDPTYGGGAFYKSLPQPEYVADIAPRHSHVTEADCRELPFLDGSMPSILFDPPFIHAHGKNSAMGNLYGSYPSQRVLREMYFDSLKEFFRVLEPGGVLVFKCMDIIESGNQILTHCYVWQMAESLGYETLDLFILANPKQAVMRGWNHSKQQHARKTHAYFMVFRRPPTKTKRKLPTLS